MIKISTLTYLFMYKSFGHETWPDNRFSHGKCFRKKTAIFVRLDPKPKPF